MTALSPPLPFTVSLPWPPRSCSPNARVDYHVRMKDASFYRQRCAVEALRVRRDMERSGYTFPLAVPVVAVIVFVLTNRKLRDFDNLLAMFKSGVDGIRDAGVIEDDNVFVFKPTLDVEIGRAYGVRVVLTGGEAA